MRLTRFARGVLRRTSTLRVLLSAAGTPCSLPRRACTELPVSLARSTAVLLRAPLSTSLTAPSQRFSRVQNSATHRRRAPFPLDASTLTTPLLR